MTYTPADVLFFYLTSFLVCLFGMVVDVASGLLLGWTLALAIFWKALLATVDVLILFNFRDRFREYYR